MGCASSHHAQPHVILVVNKGWIKKQHNSKTKKDKERLRQPKEVPKAKENGRADEIFKQRKAIYNDEVSFGKRKEGYGKKNLISYLESDHIHSTANVKRGSFSKLMDRMTVVPPQQNCVSSKIWKYKTKSTDFPNQHEIKEESSSLIKEDAKNDDNAAKITNELPDRMNLDKRTEEWNFNGLLFTDPLYNDVIALTVHKNFFNDFGDNFDDLDLS